MTRNGMTIEEITRISEEIEKKSKRLGRAIPCVIMFADLVGSTAYKQKCASQQDWLPWLAYFLMGVSSVIQESGGRVVKYIGDEVMAIFSGSSGVLDSEHCSENIIEFCQNSKKYEYKVRIALDYGDVCFIDFKMKNKLTEAANLTIMGDPQGTVVDQCARIMKKIPSHWENVALCSNSFYGESKHKSRWKVCGHFRGRGIKEVIKVYRLRDNHRPDFIEKISNDLITLPECLKRLQEIEKQFEDLKNIRQR